MGDDTEKGGNAEEGGEFASLRRKGYCNTKLFMTTAYLGIFSIFRSDRIVPGGPAGKR